MNREKAQKVISKWCRDELYVKHTEDNPLRAIGQWLYDEGYVLLSPKEVKKVDGALVFGSIHGFHFGEKPKEDND